MAMMVLSLCPPQREARRFQTSSRWVKVKEETTYVLVINFTVSVYFHMCSKNCLKKYYYKEDPNLYWLTDLVVFKILFNLTQVGRLFSQIFFFQGLMSVNCSNYNKFHFI